MPRYTDCLENMQMIGKYLFFKVGNACDERYQEKPLAMQFKSFFFSFFCISFEIILWLPIGYNDSVMCTRSHTGNFQMGFWFIDEHDGYHLHIYIEKTTIILLTLYGKVICVCGLNAFTSNDGFPLSLSRSLCTCRSIFYFVKHRNCFQLLIPLLPIACNNDK